MHSLQLPEFYTFMDNESLVFKLGDDVTDSLRHVLLKRGWVDDETKPWDLFWKTSRFTAGEQEEICDFQRINHFRKSSAITKKASA